MKRDFFKKRGTFLLLAAFALFLSDRVLKFWAYYHFQSAQYASLLYPYGGIGVFQDFLGIDFCLTRVMNRGGAWGMFGSYPTLLLISRLLIFMAIAAYTFFINREKQRVIPLLLIVTGAFGNIVDYFLYGSVIDMFHFILWGYSFPVFNIADIMIFFGTAILLVQSILQKKRIRV